MVVVSWTRNKYIYRYLSGMLICIGTIIYLVARGGPFSCLGTRKMDLDPEGSVRLQSVNPRQYLIRKKSARSGTDQVFTSSTARSIVIVVIVIMV